MNNLLHSHVVDAAILALMHRLDFMASFALLHFAFGYSLVIPSVCLKYFVNEYSSPCPIFHYYNQLVGVCVTEFVCLSSVFSSSLPMTLTFQIYSPHLFCLPRELIFLAIFLISVLPMLDGLFFISLTFHYLKSFTMSPGSSFPLTALSIIAMR
jgi:hypothetical protein